MEREREEKKGARSQRLKELAARRVGEEMRRQRIKIERVAALLPDQALLDVLNLFPLSLSSLPFYLRAARRLPDPSSLQRGLDFLRHFFLGVLGRVGVEDFVRLVVGEEEEEGEEEDQEGVDKDQEGEEQPQEGELQEGESKERKKEERRRREKEKEAQIEKFVKEQVLLRNKVLDLKLRGRVVSDPSLDGFFLAPFPFLFPLFFNKRKHHS